MTCSNMRTSLQLDDSISNKLGIIAKYHKRAKNLQIEVFIDSEIPKLDLKKAKLLNLTPDEKLVLKSMVTQN